MRLFYFTTITDEIPYLLKIFMQVSSIISPLAAIGTAGGQGTFTEAQILPREFSTGISSDSENTA